MIAGVIHQPDMIFKFGIETNREDIVLQGNRVGFEQISASELAYAPNSFEKLAPQVRQITVERKSGEAVCLMVRWSWKRRCLRGGKTRCFWNCGLRLSTERFGGRLRRGRCGRWNGKEFRAALCAPLL